MTEDDILVTDLSDEEATLAREFIRRYLDAVGEGSPSKIHDLHFQPIPQNDGGRNDEWGLGYHIRLCEYEDKTPVASFAKPFVDPGTQYFEKHEFLPKPTVWIEVTLRGDCTYTAKFACAEADDGTLLACNWALRNSPKQRESRSITAKELQVDAYVNFDGDDSYKSRIVRYCESNSVIVPPLFGRRGVSRYAVVDLSCSPPKLVALTFDAIESLVTYLDRTEIDWKRDTDPPMRILDFESGRQLHHLGGWELYDGSSFVRTENGEPDDARESPS